LKCRTRETSVGQYYWPTEVSQYYFCWPRFGFHYQRAVCVLLDAGCVVLLVFLILLALMWWRWRTHNDPLPRRARTLYDRTFRRKRTADNDIYGVHLDSQPVDNVDSVNTSRPNVVKSFFFIFILRCAMSNVY